MKWHVYLLPRKSLSIMSKKRNNCYGPLSLLRLPMHSKQLKIIPRTIHNTVYNIKFHRANTILSKLHQRWISIRGVWAAREFDIDLTFRSLGHVENKRFNPELHSNGHVSCYISHDFSYRCQRDWSSRRSSLNFTKLMEPAHEKNGSLDLSRVWVFFGCWLWIRSVKIAGWTRLSFGNAQRYGPQRLQRRRPIAPKSVVSRKTWCLAWILASSGALDALNQRWVDNMA